MRPWRNWVRLAMAASLGFACGADRNDGAEASEVTARDALLDPTHEFWSTEAPDVFAARFATSVGTFEIEVHRAWAPIGVDRFYNLVRSGFYDDQRIFRVVDGFIAQFGLSGDPEITAVWKGATVPDDPVIESNVRGSVAYAMTGPDTRWTQIYINYADNSRLDEQGFAPFGRVVVGMDVVDSIYSGYGEGAGGGMRRGDQSSIEAEGNVHLDRDFPNLTRIDRVTIVDR